MDSWVCPECGGELEVTGEEERLETFILPVDCVDCGESFLLIFNAESEKPWTCPKCGGECAWDMDEQIEYSDDETSIEVYGACEECGCEVVEVYNYARTEHLHFD